MQQDAIAAQQGEDLLRHVRLVSIIAAVIVHPETCTVCPRIFQAAMVDNILCTFNTIINERFDVQVQTSRPLAVRATLLRAELHISLRHSKVEQS